MLQCNELYLIKDLAYVTGYSVDTIKYYLKIGLIREAGKTPRTNFRFFNENSAEILRKIHALRIQGCSIAQIRETLSLGTG